MSSTPILLHTNESTTTRNNLPCPFSGTQDNCLTRYKLDDQTCEAHYTYKAQNGVMKVAVTKNECWKTLPAAASIGIIIGAVLAVGALGILIYKIRITIKDREEYKKFLIEKEQFSTMQNENPIYNSPIRKYELPEEFEMETRHSKLE